MCESRNSRKISVLVCLWFIDRICVIHIDKSRQIVNLTWFFFILGDEVYIFFEQNKFPAREFVTGIVGFHNKKKKNENFTGASK